MHLSIYASMNLCIYASMHLIWGRGSAACVPTPPLLLFYVVGRCFLCVLSVDNYLLVHCSTFSVCSVCKSSVSWGS